MEFRVLGQVEAADGGMRCPVSAGRQLALLALLVLHANQVISADRILDELWGDDPPESGAKTVGFHVSKLRDALAPGRARVARPVGDGGGARAAGDGRRARPASVDGGALLTLDGGYLLRVDADRLDAARFERLAGEGRALLAADPASASDRLAAALAEWRGPAYAQVADEPFARPEIARLEELRLRATEDAFDAALALGRHDEIVVALVAHVDANPLREHARASLMTALYRAGRQAEALRAFADGRTILAEDLGIEPGPELRRLEALVLQQDPALDLPPDPAAGTGTGHAASTGPRGAATGAAAPLRNPYKGLRSFGEADAADFFGRETLVASLLDRLGSLVRGTRLLVLVGPSGSGKSSVVQAGIVPAIRAGAIPALAGAPIVSLLPGTHPVRDLERALAELHDAGSPTCVLVVDQLEELPTLAGDEEAGRFLDSLEDALSRSPDDGSPMLVVIATLRADRLDLPLGVPGLGERVRRGTEIVGPLARDDLERAICRPAERLGLEVEPGLAREIATDVGSQPGALPLLQFALTDLFERRDGTRLTRAAYLASGGVEGALAARAEEAWAALDGSERLVARQVFLRLVAVTESGDPVGRRRPRGDLAASAPNATQLDCLLDALARRRLIALDRDPGNGDPMVQVAHDALLTRWPRLAGWIREARDDLAMRRRLSDATVEWEASACDAGFLLAGSRLDLFAAWAATTDLRPDAHERSLLDASLAARGRSEAAEAARAAREHGLEQRATTRLRALVAVLTAGIVAVSGLSIGLYRQSAMAVEQARIAAAREAAAAATGTVGTDPRLALLIAWQAATSTADLGYVTEQAMDALHWALQASHVAYPAGADGSSGAQRDGVRTGPHGPAAVPLLEPRALLALAASQSGRDLTVAECRTYLHRDTCPAPPTSTAAPTAELGVLTAEGVVPAASLASEDLAGTSVDLVSQLPVDITGPLAALLEGAGVTVSLADDDAGKVLPERIASGDEPDIAIVARPHDVLGLARGGHLVDLATLVDRQALIATAGDYLLAAGSVGPDGSWPTDGGRLVGAPFAVTDESLLWTSSTDGAAPATWADALREVRLGAGARSGGWCLGLAGDTGADLVGILEDGLLGSGDTIAYDEWAVGSVGSHQRAARAAFARVRDVTDPGLVAGGLARAEATPPDIAAWPMLEIPSGCTYHPGGGRDRLDWYADPDVTPRPVPVPGTTAGTAPLVRGRLYTVVVLHDRPEVRQVLDALLGSGRDAGLDSTLATGGLWRPGSATGPEPERAWLQAALRDGRFRIALADSTPARVASAMSEGIARYPTGDEDAFALFISGLGQAWKEAWDAGETGLAGD